MTGLHPTHVNNEYNLELNHVRKNLDTSDFCAIGEIGTDLYWDKTNLLNTDLIEIRPDDLQSDSGVKREAISIELIEKNELKSNNSKFIWYGCRKSVSIHCIVAITGSPNSYSLNLGPGNL